MNAKDEWRRTMIRTAVAVTCAVLSGGAIAQQATSPPLPVPVAPRDEGEGPYERLILRGAYMVDGTGAPAQGPVDIVVVQDRIAGIHIVGAPKLAVDPERRLRSDPQRIQERRTKPVLASLSPGYPQFHWRRLPAPQATHFVVSYRPFGELRDLPAQYHRTALYWQPQFRQRYH